MIYINKHKEYHNPVPKDYEELYGGSLFTDVDVDNINYLNPYINEMTGLYYVWKNKKDKYVGLCHYKRFFYKDGDMLTLEDAKKILKNCDIIIKEDVVFNMSLYWQLRFEVENSDILDKYLNKIYEVEPDFKEYLNRKQFNNSEMFVCKRELIEKYCEWLFPMIIPITEEYIKEDVKRGNTRLIGHIIERLFAYWIYKNKLKTYVVDYIDI